jgi:hypothetical protein
VIGRAAKPTQPGRKSKQPRTDADGNLIVQTLGSSSVELYVSAIMELWKMQHSLLQNQ